MPSMQGLDMGLSDTLGKESELTELEEKFMFDKRAKSAANAANQGPKLLPNIGFCIRTKILKSTSTKEATS